MIELVVLFLFGGLLAFYVEWSIMLLVLVSPLILAVFAGELLLRRFRRRSGGSARRLPTS